MMSLRHLFLVMVFFVSTVAAAQDYVAYQRVFNRVDDYIATEDWNKALLSMDSVGTKYRFVYAKHCLKALQVACMANDTVRAAYWLSRSFTQGVPPWVIRSNTITAKVLSYPVTTSVLGHYDSLRSIYYANVNLKLAHRTDSMMNIDSKYTRRVNNGFFLVRYTVSGLQWVHNNNRSYRWIKQTISQYGFPGERLIGLPLGIEDSTSAAGKFVRAVGIGLGMEERSAVFMLLHYYSTKREDAMQVFVPALHDGNLPPKYFARINDYNIIVSPRKTKHMRECYTHRLNHTENTDSVNARREAIGLNTYEAQQANAATDMRNTRSGANNKAFVLE